VSLVLVRRIRNFVFGRIGLICVVLSNGFGDALGIGE
jgi:hypothetical protein